MKNLKSFLFFFLFSFAIQASEATEQKDDLLEAVKSSTAEHVQALINKGVNLQDYSNAEGNLFHVWARSKNRDEATFDVLLKAGVDLSEMSVDNESVLILLLLSLGEDVVRISQNIFTLKAEGDSEYEEKKAHSEKKLSDITRLLEKVLGVLKEREIDLLGADEEGRIAFQLAAYYGFMSLLPDLYSPELDLDAPLDENDLPLLHLIFENGVVVDPLAIPFVVEKGAKVNQFFGSSGETALYSAVRNYHFFKEGFGSQKYCVLKAIHYLLGAGADPKAENEDGVTALSFAEEKGLTEIVTLLQSRSSR